MAKRASTVATRGPGRPAGSVNRVRDAGDTAGNRGATGRRRKSIDEFIDEDTGYVDGQSPDETYAELKDSARRIFGPGWDRGETNDPRSASGRFSNARGGYQDNYYQSEYQRPQRRAQPTNYIRQNRNPSGDVVERFEIARENYLQAKDEYMQFLDNEAE